jgi:hypothetical protein
VTDRDELRHAAAKVLDRDEVEGVLSSTFYASNGSEHSQARSNARGRDDKPTHYKVICISMYTDALDRLDAMVKELKLRGYTKANRSALIRHALNNVDLDKVPRGL